MKKILFILGLMLGGTAMAQGILRQGTIVPLTITEETTSKMSDAPQVVVAANVLDSEGNVAIQAGTPVAVDYRNEAAGRCGRPGVLSFKFETTTAVDGTPVILNSKRLKRMGKNKQGKVMGLGLGLGFCTVTPMFLLLLKRGGEAMVEAGTTVNTVTVLTDTPVKSAARN